MSASKKYASATIAPLILQALDTPASIGNRDQVREALTNLVDDYLVKHVYEGVLAALRSPQIEQRIKQLLNEEIDTLVRAEVAKRADELEGRVRTAVGERFEEQIAATARRLLDEELEKVRRRIC